MKVGYMRVSTSEQNLDLQSDGLKKAGCNKIFRDEGVKPPESGPPFKLDFSYDFL
jgi:DNA invertase Pin-like site-specific DNA recombinase